MSALHSSTQLRRGQGAVDNRLSRIQTQETERGGGDARPPHRGRRLGQRLRQEVPVLVIAALNPAHAYIHTQKVKPHARNRKPL